MPTITPICSICSSEEVLKDAFAEWSEKEQDWVLQNTFETYYCETCEGECFIEWK